MNKILVAADGSEFTMKAVKYLIGHLEQFGAQPEIELIHVKTPLPSRPASALGKETVKKYYAEETAKSLAPARRALDKAGVKYSVVARVGDAAAEIAAYAEKGKFTMLVMGSHGHGALASLALGSVATKVLAHCTTPLLIIR
jgi:nucleotide-binding universal stress UspA family protein